MSEDIAGRMVKGPSGRHLGRITRTATDQFCVQVEDAVVWLSRDVIFSIEEDQVTVIFEPSAVERYALKPTPRHSEQTG